MKVRSRFVRLTVVVALATTTTLVGAQQDIYKCVDERGNTTFSNYIAGKCVKMNVDPVTTNPKNSQQAKPRISKPKSAFPPKVTPRLPGTTDV